ncbi:hypothetical protein RUM43_005950 [Polyplax serrata]|uniref:Uncharacterized protein n=1 Tax=Polyplax serrata TaxID=468196 RepID=A0AAN8PAC5_POLSC
MKWDILFLVYMLSLAPNCSSGLECFSCVKVSPPCLCAKACDKSHPPCKSPFVKSHKVTCDEGDSCVAVTQVHVGKVLNLFGCYNCQTMLEEVPGVKCTECNDDLCNDQAPTSCDMVRTTLTQVDFKLKLSVSL